MTIGIGTDSEDAEGKSFPKQKLKNSMIPTERLLSLWVEGSRFAPLFSPQNGRNETLRICARGRDVERKPREVVIHSWKEKAR